MRDAFHEDLDRISDELVQMTSMVQQAMSRATTALLQADLSVAESVIAGDDDIDELRRSVDDSAVDLLARQQPVATDLRMVVTAMHMASDIERMGDLARHIAKAARRRYPENAVPEQLRPVLSEMERVAESLVVKTGQAIANKDVLAAADLQRAPGATGGSPAVSPARPVAASAPASNGSMGAPVPEVTAPASPASRPAPPPARPDEPARR